MGGCGSRWLCGGLERLRVDKAGSESRLSATSHGLDLPHDQVVMARQQWTHARATQKTIGHRIIVKFLAERPDARRAFHLPKTAIEKEHLEEFGFLKLHGSKLENFLTGFVDGADNDPVEAKNQCRTLGRMHFYKGVAFDQELFDDFKYYVVDAIFEGQQPTASEAERRPWLQLLDYFNKQLLHGILHESVAKQCLGPTTFTLGSGRQTALTGTRSRHPSSRGSVSSHSVPDAVHNATTAVACASPNKLVSSGSYKSLCARVNSGGVGGRPLLWTIRRRLSQTQEQQQQQYSPTLLSMRTGGGSHKHICRKLTSATVTSGSSKKMSVVNKKNSTPTLFQDSSKHRGRSLDQSSTRRGSCSANALSDNNGGASSSTAANGPLLSWDERELLRVMWSRVDESDGLHIVADLLSTYPHLMAYFGIADAPADAELLANHVVVKVHGCRLYGYLDNMIHLIINDKTTHAVDVTHRVGQIHYHRGVHFTANNWLAFKKIIVKHCLAALPSQSAASVRSGSVVLEKLLRFITQNMRHGFIQVALQGQTDAPSISSVTDEQLRRLQCEEDNLSIAASPVVQAHAADSPDS